MKIVICGAGPVGALAAIYAARRGHEVEIYELRGDSSCTQEKDASRQLGKSINLTMSDRGFEALRDSGDPSLVRDVVYGTVAVRAREVHETDKTGSPRSTRVQYDAGGKHLNVVSRGTLRDILVKRVQELPNTKIFYNRKLMHADLNARYAIFADSTAGDVWRDGQQQQQYTCVNFDLLIGADGAHSAVRQQMSRYTHIDLSQRWLDTWWCEFRIAARVVDEATGIGRRPRLALDALHVWPQSKFMFIALPNQDGSFTCNLFAPRAVFDELDELSRGDEAEAEQGLAAFFQRHLPGIVPGLMTPRQLREQLAATTPSALQDVRVSPVNYGDRCVLVGDAAHTMVPFYGQGLNVGLEDVRILFTEYLAAPSAAVRTPSAAEKGEAEDYFFTRHHASSPSPHHPPSTPYSPAPPSLPATGLSVYSQRRQPDVSVMSSFALDNYAEMRLAQKSVAKKARRMVEQALQTWLPSAGWRTLYSRVAFSTESFGEIKRKDRNQGVALAVLAAAVMSMALMMLVQLILCAWECCEGMMDASRLWS